MKKITIPLALVLGTIVSEVNAQTVVVRRPIHRVVVAPSPVARVIVVRPLPHVVVTPLPIVIAPRPVIVRPAPLAVQAAPAPSPSSTIVVRKKTVIHKS